MPSLELRNDPRREQSNRTILEDRRLNGKQNFPVVVSRAPYTSTVSVNTYQQRVRQLPPLNTSNNVATMAKAIESGCMQSSVGNNNRMRSPPRHVKTQVERTARTNLTNTQRIRAQNHDRLIPIKNTVSSELIVEHVSPQTVTVYSIASLPQTTNDDGYQSKVPENPVIDKKASNKSSSVDESILRKGGLCGLQNLGNTCFMNSVLQCLSNTKPLLLFCLQDNLKDYLNKSSTSVMKGAIMTEYAYLIGEMWLESDGRSVISPSKFKSTIGNFASRFTGYAEQDSQEFLRYLLQGLSEDVNRVRQKPTPNIVDEKQEERMKEKDRAKKSWERCLRYEDSPLVDIFAGQLKSTLECSYCQYKSITFDMFWDLSLPLPRDGSSTTLQECIQLFMSKEVLSGDEEPTCTNCKKKRPCTKKLSIQKCPEILVLHLKRFSQTRGKNKLNTYVDFPITSLRLDNLTEVMSDSYDGPAPVYNLFGISNHSGTIYTGHYIAQCKHPFTQEWHEFNDSSVHLISDTSSIVSNNAYVLFYERKKL